jgi:hypothetical protein
MLMVGVMLNPPRAAFARPVRAYETMTASLLMGLPSLKKIWIAPTMAQLARAR